MRTKVLVLTTLWLLVCAFALTDVGHAKNSSVVKTAVEAELTPCCGGPEPGAEGEAARTTLKKNGVTQIDRFKGEVTVPVDPSSALGITDETAAAAADIRLIFSRGGNPYAECFLVLAEIETEEEEGALVTEAEYKVDVRQRLTNGTTVLQEVRGTCDTDLGTLGIQAGIPDVQAGDVATARLVLPSPPGPLDFLQGTFVAQ